MAREEILEFRIQADTYDDNELMQLGEIAKAGLADQKKVFETREEVICYLALNGGARIEDLWVADATEWLEAPVRKIKYPDMVARRRDQMLHGQLAPALKEDDFVCYTDKEVRSFACDMRSLFLHDRSRHLVTCSRCRTMLKCWTKLLQEFGHHALQQQRRPDA